MPKDTLSLLNAVQDTDAVGADAETHSEAQCISPTLHAFIIDTFIPPSLHCSAVSVILGDRPTISLLVPFTLADTDSSCTMDTVAALQTLYL